MPDSKQITLHDPGTDEYDEILLLWERAGLSGRGVVVSIWRRTGVMGILDPGHLADQPCPRPRGIYHDRC